MSVIKTEDTKLFIHNPQTNELYKVGRTTAIGSASAPRSQIDVTDLESKVRTYVAGLREPGATNFSIIVDPSLDSHHKVQELYKTGDVVDFIISLDGASEPTLADTDSVTLPATGSFITYAGYVSDWNISTEINNVVRAEVAVQISGDVDTHLATEETV